MAFLSSRQTAAYRIRLQHIHFAFSISLSWLLYLVMENKRKASKMLMQLKMYTNSCSPIHKYIYIFTIFLCIIYSFGYLFFSVLFGLTLDDGLGILVKYVWGQEGKNVASLKCFAHRFLFMHTCNVICGCSFFMHNDVNNWSHNLFYAIQQHIIVRQPAPNYAHKTYVYIFAHFQLAACFASSCSFYLLARYRFLGLWHVFVCTHCILCHNVHYTEIIKWTCIVITYSLSL